MASSDIGALFARVSAALQNDLAMAVGFTAALALLLLLWFVRGRRHARSRRWEGSKVSPRRTAGRPRETRRSRERVASVPTQEADPDMMAASTRNYHQTLEALLRQPGKKSGARPLRRLLELARVLEIHRAGDLKDLSGFAGEVELLLGFEVRPRPMPNSTGVALRIMHEGQLIEEVAGPFRGEIADRVAERARALQLDLLAWFDSLRVLLPDPGAASADATAPVRSRTAAGAQQPAATGEVPAGWVETIDVSGLRPADAVRSGAANDLGERASAYEVDEDAPPIEPIDPDITPPAFDGGPPQDPFGPDRHAGTRRPREAPDPIAASPPAEARATPLRRPPPQGLPPRLTRAIEEVDGIIAELEVEPPASTQAGERFFKADSSDRTSLLDRLDRLVFAPFDDAGLTAEHGADGQVARAAEWLRRRRERLIEVLRDDFGLRAYHADVGDPFQPTEHVATDTVATGDPRRDRTVARTVKHGYALEMDGERRVLERSKVTIATYEANATDAEPTAAAGSPAADTGGIIAETLDVPVDTAYPGERDFSITVYARWQIDAPLRAWLEVDERRLDFARAEVVEVRGTQSTVRLSGCDIPADIRRGDGFLVVEDDRHRARHPFEVIT